MQMTELGDQRRCPLLMCLQDKRTATEVDSCLDKIFLIKCKKKGGVAFPPPSLRYLWKLILNSINLVYKEKSDLQKQHLRTGHERRDGRGRTGSEDFVFVTIKYKINLIPPYGLE